MPALADLKIKIFADSADLAQIRMLRQNPLIKGFTTNPTLARQAKVRDYLEWAYAAAEAAKGLPISFEVIADEFVEMERQARMLAGLGENVYVKIPITNTRGESSVPLIENLAAERIKVNVTAVMTKAQFILAAGVFRFLETPSIISVFAGRMADAGVYPQTVLHNMKSWFRMRDQLNTEILWASTREVLNIFQAEDDCHIVTVTPDLLKKLPLVGKDLGEYSLDTVKTFYQDAVLAGYRL